MSRAKRPFSPLKAIIFGAAGTLLFGACGVYLLVTSPDQFDKADVLLIEGDVVSTEEITHRRGARTYQVWLNHESLPFRSSGMYPASFNQGALAEVRPGAHVTIGIDPREQTSPRIDRLQGQLFLRIVSLQVGDHVALSLDSFNAWQTQNRRIGNYVVPVMILMSLALLVGGIRARRSER